MKGIVLLLLFFSSQSRAIILDEHLNGKWTPEAFAHNSVRIRSDRVNFKGCKTAIIISKQFIDDLEMHEIDLIQQRWKIDLYAHGKKNRSCLDRGQHICELILGYWRWNTKQIYLMISCDQNRFVRMYKKKI